MRILSLSSSMALAALLLGVAARPAAAQEAAPRPPAIRATDRVLAITAWRPPQGQKCTVDGNDIPDPTSILDPAALAAPLAEVARRGQVLLHLNTDSIGLELDTIRVIESTLAPDETLALVEAVRRAYLPPATKTSVATRILLKAGAKPQVTLGPTLGCKPALRSRDDLQRAINAMGHKYKTSAAALVHVFVREDGTVEAAKLEVPTGIAALDEDLLAAARQLVFHPAVWDQQRLAVWVAFPVRLVVP